MNQLLALLLTDSLQTPYRLLTDEPTIGLTPYRLLTDSLQMNQLLALLLTDSLQMNQLLALLLADSLKMTDAPGAITITITDRPSY
jgi:hypothetical protein